MTTTTIDPSTVATMQGRELDQAVHFALTGKHSCACFAPMRRYNPETGFCSECHYNVAPHYSTDPAAFFAMVERVRQSGWEVVNMCYYRSTKGWYVRLDDAKFRPVTATGDTLPLAFARAALLTTIPGGAS